jgi:Zn-dependent alcohol dehydrogenase
VGVGVIPVTDTVSIPALPLVLQQQQFLGSSYGGTRPQIDIPVLADLALKGELKLKEMITKQFILEEINEALEAMEKRKIIGRWVCDHKSL